MFSSPLLVALCIVLAHGQARSEYLESRLSSCLSPLATCAIKS